MNFSEFIDINDFYTKTGMSREQTFNFLKRQLELLENKNRRSKKYRTRTDKSTFGRV